VTIFFFWHGEAGESAADRPATAVLDDPRNQNELAAMRMKRDFSTQSLLLIVLPVVIASVPFITRVRAARGLVFLTVSWGYLAVSASWQSILE
jgi:hypothetical protein